MVVVQLDRLGPVTTGVVRVADDDVGVVSAGGSRIGIDQIESPAVRAGAVVPGETCLCLDAAIGLCGDCHLAADVCGGNGNLRTKTAGDEAGGIHVHKNRGWSARDR